MISEGSAVIAFTPSTDLARSRDFYEGVLGLPVQEANPYALLLRSSSTMIRVTLVDQLTPQPFTILGWIVPDIAAEVEALTAKGVPFTRHDGMSQNDLGIWTSPSGDQIAWFTDPDANTLSLTQLRAS